MKTQSTPAILLKLHKSQRISRANCILKASHSLLSSIWTECLLICVKTKSPTQIMQVKSNKEKVWNQHWPRWRNGLWLFLSQKWWMNFENFTTILSIFLKLNCFFFIKCFVDLTRVLCPSFPSTKILNIYWLVMSSCIK